MCEYFWSQGFFPPRFHRHFSPEWRAKLVPKLQDSITSLTERPRANDELITCTFISQNEVQEFNIDMYEDEDSCMNMHLPMCVERLEQGWSVAAAAAAAAASGWL